MATLNETDSSLNWTLHFDPESLKGLSDEEVEEKRDQFQAMLVDNVAEMLRVYDKAAEIRDEPVMREVVATVRAITKQEEGGWKLELALREEDQDIIKRGVLTVGYMIRFPINQALLGTRY